MFHDKTLAPDPAEVPDEQLQIVAGNRTALGVYTWDPYMHNPKLPHRLHRIKIPTHFIWGASDGLVTTDYGKILRHDQRATMTIIEEAGHSPQLEQPDRFVDAVLDMAG